MPAFATGSISNSALSVGGSPLRLRLYRELAWTGAGTDPEMGSMPRRGRFVGGGEWSPGERRWGEGGHDESECLLMRSRWEGVDGRQKERAKGRRYVLC
jgi:hypothetical protein